MSLRLCCKSGIISRQLNPRSRAANPTGTTAYLGGKQHG